MPPVDLFITAPQQTQLASAAAPIHAADARRIFSEANPLVRRCLMQRVARAHDMNAAQR